MENNPSGNARDAKYMGLIPGSRRPLEEEVAPNSNILPWRIPRTEEPGDYSPGSHQESDMTFLICEVSDLFTKLSIYSLMLGVGWLLLGSENTRLLDKMCCHSSGRYNRVEKLEK